MRARHATALRRGARGRLVAPLQVLSLLLLVAQVLPAIGQERCVGSGTASYYAKEFHGKVTANGERYSMWAMTAAHQTLPFNSLIRVTNLANRRSVVVRINDAGPFKDDRIIDLSYAAAVKLDMVRAGTSRVRLELVGNADPDAERTEIYRVGADRADLDGFAVQLASFTDSGNLLRRLEAFRAKGIRNLYVQVAVVRGETVHRILVGGFDERDEAERACAALRGKGVAGMVLRVR
jgi:rare lipoprotein A